LILKGRGRLLRIEKDCPPWAGLSCFQTNQRSSNQCPKRRLRPPVLRNSADIPWEENRPRHKVDKRIYGLLTIFLGWCGVHRFLEHRWKLGVFYLLVGWTGLGLAFALVDLLIALPIPKDENGMIEI
jgi:TM2 domain-containing membrane protein YozV